MDRLDWNYCTDDQLKGKFDITKIDNDATTTTLLSAESICKTPSVQEMDSDKCIRSFLHNWVSVMMIKLIVVNALQIIGVLWKLLKERCMGKKIKILIDVEYVTITVNLLISIMFSFLSIFYNLL